MSTTKPRKKSEHLNILVGEDLKAAIIKAANERNKTITSLTLSGLVKEAPELAQAVIEDR